MSLLDALIAQGMKYNEDFTKELIKIKQRVEATPERQAISDLQSTTGAMQVVDEFTLSNTVNTQIDTQVMKDIDEFTLGQVMSIDERLSAIESKVNGGNE